MALGRAGQTRVHPMLTAYYYTEKRLEILPPDLPLERAEWIDLVNASPDEEWKRSKSRTGFIMRMTPII